MERMSVSPASLYHRRVFKEPDWEASIDFEARLASIPERAQVRGMFLQYLIRAIGADPVPHFGPRRYVAFKTYPMRDYVELLRWGAQTAFPQLPEAEAVRRLGRCIYPNYADTVTGTAIFAMAGHDFTRVVELTPTAYKVSVPPARIHVRLLEERHAIVELRDLWNLPEFHQVGIWEGAMQVCRAIGRIDVDVLGPDAVDFEIRWNNAVRTSQHA
jgi:uncharacterized protein (TIGR02265 family)